MQFSADILNTLVAPEVSELRSHLAPELEAPANYFGSFVLTYGLGGIRFPPGHMLAIAVFLRRLSQSQSSYTSAREALDTFVRARIGPEPSDKIGSYLSALASFEQCVISLSLAANANQKFQELVVPGKPEMYKDGDGSVADRLFAIYDTVRHVTDRVTATAGTLEIAPVWLTPQGLKCVRRRNRSGPARVAELNYVELIQTMATLTENAKWLAESILADLRNQTPASDKS